jgi:signal transduction histidine kinase
MRNTPGVGLGLNLVAAIVKLHGFRLVIYPGPGGRLEIICPNRSSEAVNLFDCSQAV